jgi:hypothetical protein
MRQKRDPLQDYKGFLIQDSLDSPVSGLQSEFIACDF